MNAAAPGNVKMGLVESGKPVVPRCHIPWQQMVIDSTGAAAPCCYWGAYDNLNHPIGNVKKQSIEKIWNGPGYKKLRAGMAAGDLKAAGCEKCHALKQGMALGLDYDRAADQDDVTPYGRNIKILKEEIASGATVLQAKPTIVSYTPSHRCNIRCTHCYQEGTRDAEISRADAAEEVERLAPYLVRLIAGGGEPFLLPIWRKFLANFDQSKNPYLDFGTSTNATVITDKVIASLGHFKNLTINVSLDGTREVYERVRVGAKFDEVAANIRKLKDVVRKARSPDANIGISMCVMKSNILDLPNLVRFARDEGLQFGMSPVVSEPPDESLRCFNDPVKEMAGWNDAIDAAKAELDSYLPALAVIWHQQEVLESTRIAWLHLFEVLRENIPFEIATMPHSRVTLAFPEKILARAKATHGNSKLIAYVHPKSAADGISYFGIVEKGRCEISLPAGSFSVGLSTKWKPPFYREEGLFDVKANDAMIMVRAGRFLWPLRIARGALRRAKRYAEASGAQLW
jgi:radical SAM protein with 4Fe4S-binding SPASM domain